MEPSDVRVTCLHRLARISIESQLSVMEHNCNNDVRTAVIESCVESIRGNRSTAR
jgi:hypothetical protein